MKIKKTIFVIFLAFVLTINYSEHVYAYGDVEYDKQIDYNDYYCRIDLSTGEESLVLKRSVRSDGNRKTQATSSFCPNNEKHGVSITSIIGEDDRTQISDTSEFPYSAIARIEMTFTDGSVSIGTGFMVSKNVMLTAAHCFFSKNNSDARISTMKANLGQNGEDVLATANGKELYVCANYKYFGDSVQDDYAIVVLDADVGNTTGWFGLGTKGDLMLKLTKMTIAGYPGDKEPGTMWKATGKITEVSRFEIRHEIDMKGASCII